MAFSLGFAEEFYYGDEGYSLDCPPPASDIPNSVLQALYSLDEQEIAEICNDLDIDTTYMMHDSIIAELLDRIREVDTCTDLSSPVEVWIDEEGYNTIYVH